MKLILHNLIKAMRKISKSVAGFSAAILTVYLLLAIILAEVETASPDANIKSVGDVIWYSIVTVTTVGYGDYYPVTWAGRILGLIFIFASVGILGIIIGKISERFTEMREAKKMGFQGTSFSNHVIILGWNSFARMITHQLLSTGNRVAIVTDKKDEVDLIDSEYKDRSDNVFVLFNDLKNIGQLEKANVQEAYILFANMPNDTDNLITILNIKKGHPHLKFLVALENSELEDTFYSAGVNYVLSKNEIAATLIASYIFEPDVAEFTTDVITAIDGNERFQYDIKQFALSEKHECTGKTYGEVFALMKKRFNAIGVGFSRVRDGKRQIMKLPADDTILEAADFLLLITSQAKVSDLNKYFGQAEGVMH